KAKSILRTYALGRCGAGEARTTSTSSRINSFGLRKSKFCKKKLADRVLENANANSRVLSCEEAIALLQEHREVINSFA
ncbi:MAG: hypothetical protein ACK54D_10945, partial [Pseudanabaena sp.]